MRILMIALFCCVSATLAAYTGIPSTPVGCGGDPNAESKPCGDPCPITCENKDAGGPRICPRICIPNGCGCKTGYVKDVKGKCILPAKCPVLSTPAPVGCGGDPNAESKPCGDPCPTTCENKDAGGPQVCAAICIVDGCGCKAGFVKDINGKCILPTNCPAPPTPVGCGGDPNAESKPCGDPCPITCENKDAGGPMICPAICIVDGCGCKTGFVKDVNGKCILPDNCLGCGGGPNAESKPCGDPCPITCENKDAGGPKICPYYYLLNGCGCKTGFVKDINGKCILPDKCPKPTCAKNEVYSSCKNPCPETCERLVAGGPQIMCLPPYPCPGGCDCASGYVRNKNNVCVLPSQCPCPDPNAEFVNCPNPCPPTCDNLATFGKTPCARMCLATGCTCKKGFVFDTNGKCIKPNKCPKISKPTCAKNEVYSSCKNPCPETCEQLVAGGPQIMCMPLYPCPGGCDCASGFVRNKNNVCVLPSQCPCPDPNAEFVNCPNPCPHTCDNLATFGKTPCARMCLATGCTCKKGFVFDTNGKCIKPNKCPKICKK